MNFRTYTSKIAAITILTTSLFLAGCGASKTWQGFKEDIGWGNETERPAIILSEDKNYSNIGDYTVEEGARVDLEFIANIIAGNVVAEGQKGLKHPTFKGELKEVDPATKLFAAQYVDKITGDKNNPDYNNGTLTAAESGAALESIILNGVPARQIGTDLPAEKQNQDYSDKVSGDLFQYMPYPKSRKENTVIKYVGDIDFKMTENDFAEHVTDLYNRWVNDNPELVQGIESRYGEDIRTADVTAIKTAKGTVLYQKDKPKEMLNPKDFRKGHRAYVSYDSQPAPKQ